MHRSVVFAIVACSLAALPAAAAGPWNDWQPAGLQGGPVRSLVLSPTFDEDRTLFAIAGPASAGLLDVGGALHRSADGATTWQGTALGDIHSVALSPGFARDSVVVAAASDKVWLSVDGGGTWRESLAEPAVITLGETATGPPTIFAIAGGALVASDDLGSTWRIGLAAARAVERIDLSPAYRLDQTILATIAGAVLRSSDGGLSWQEAFIIPPGQRARIHFSPTFLQDRTAFSVVAVPDFPTLLLDVPTSERSDDHERSLGVLRTVDGGATWRSLDLRVEGTPYRHVYALALSPHFAADRTVIVVGWGPRGPTPYMGGTARGQTEAIFMSEDGGDRFTQPFSLPPGGMRWYTRPLFSPRYDADQTVYFGLSSSSGSPASGHCDYFRVVAGGPAVRFAASGAYDSCFDLAASPPGPLGFWWLLWRTGQTPVLSRSYDGSTSAMPLGVQLGPLVRAKDGIVYPTSFATDGLAFAATNDGVWTTRFSGLGPIGLLPSLR